MIKPNKLYMIKPVYDKTKHIYIYIHVYDKTKQIFLPYVPVYDKTKKEIVSMSAGKSVDMTDINQGRNIVNYNLTVLWEEKTG